MSKQVKLSRQITDLATLSTRANEIESILSKVSALIFNKTNDDAFTVQMEAFEEVLNDELETISAKAKLLYRAVS